MRRKFSVNYATFRKDPRIVDSYDPSIIILNQSNKEHSITLRGFGFNKRITNAKIKW